MIVISKAAHSLETKAIRILNRLMSYGGCACFAFIVFSVQYGNYRLTHSAVSGVCAFLLSWLGVELGFSRVEAGIPSLEEQGKNIPDDPW